MENIFTNLNLYGKINLIKYFEAKMLNNLVFFSIFFYIMTEFGFINMMK